MPWYAVALAVLALGGTGCGKRAPGSCREDVDCPPGFDCVSAACMHRERLRFGGAGGAPAQEPAPEATPEAPAFRASPPIEVQPGPAIQRPPSVKPKPAPPAEPLAPPSLPPAAPPDQRLPAWKQRLKNT